MLYILYLFLYEQSRELGNVLCSLYTLHLPLRLRSGTKTLLVKVNRRSVPLEDAPFDTSSVLLLCDLAQVSEEALAKARLAVLWVYVQVLEVDTRAAKPGRVGEEVLQCQQTSQLQQTRQMPTALPSSVRAMRDSAYFSSKRALRIYCERTSTQPYQFGSRNNGIRLLLVNCLSSATYHLYHNGRGQQSTAEDQADVSHLPTSTHDVLWRRLLDCDLGRHFERCSQVSTFVRRLLGHQRSI